MEKIGIRARSEWVSEVLGHILALEEILENNVDPSTKDETKKNFRLAQAKLWEAARMAEEGAGDDKIRKHMLRAVEILAERRIE